MTEADSRQTLAPDMGQAGAAIGLGSITRHGAAQKQNHIETIHFATLPLQTTEILVAFNFVIQSTIEPMQRNPAKVRNGQGNLPLAAEE